ncbi:unnamed protein product [Psylliodes chrysocephalus]|uniref:CCHC-type domain-containing protein n=1 Tax=Psylliodes chrysocephalus TaxID=3402493 RepID=A0A9P0CG51_9CUCU|nr:unnamed protein product [Psylliodes chrysocephala]
MGTYNDTMETSIIYATFFTELAERKIRNDEDVHEYFLKMKELSNRGDIETEALIQYVIDGIHDDDRNKIILYAAKTNREFKEKLKVYSDMKANTSKRADRTVVQNRGSQQSNIQERKDTVTRQENKQSVKSTIRCFNCNVIGHKSENFHKKRLGMKCFRCYNFGHKSYECQRAKTEQRRESPKEPTLVNRIVAADSNRKFKKIKM